MAAASGREEQYSTVVDMVDAGADPNGNESVSSVIQQHIDDDTLLKFPEGRYYMDEQVRFTSFENVGIVSEEGAEVTLVPANYHEFDGPPRLFRLGTAGNPGRDLHFEGFRVDQTADDTGIRVLNAEVEDGLYVKNVFIHGVHDSGTWGPGLFNVLDPNGEGVVECFRAFDGGVFSDETPNGGTVRRGSTGIHVNSNHQGTLTFRSCVLGGFAGTGLYASSEGRVNVEGGWYENSVTGSLRMGVTEGRIEDAIAVVDDPIEDRAVLQHPIRLDHGDRIEVENVTIDTPDPNGNALRVMAGVEDAEISDTRIVNGGDSSAVRIDEDAGATTFDNVEVEMNGDAYAFRLLGDDAGEVTLRNVSITGDANGSPVPPSIFCTRNDCTFESVAVDQPGTDRRGLELRGQNYVVADSEFETTKTPIVVHNADDVRIENTYAQSYESGPSLRIFGDSGAVHLEDNDFPDGVDDRR